MLDVFKQEGYYTISTDEIVANLYKEEKVAIHIGKMFNLSFPNKVVDKDILREHLINNPKDKKKLENYVHPLVIEETKRLLSNNESDIRIVEVPLLFQSKMDRLFDSIIIVNSSISTREKHQKSRDGGKASALRVINESNVIDDRMLEAEFVINNDGSTIDLVKETKKVINKLKSRLG